MSVYFQGGYQLDPRELEPELQRGLCDVQPGEQDQQGPPGLPPHRLHHPPHGQVREHRERTNIRLTCGQDPQGRVVVVLSLACYERLI